MRTLQEWMGHRDFATTLIYADFAPSEEHETAWIEGAFATPATTQAIA
jgi:site-specific recombinase XerD